VRLPASFAAAGQVFFDRPKIVEPLGCAAYFSDHTVAEEGLEGSAQLIRAAPNGETGQLQPAGDLGHALSLGDERKQPPVVSTLRAVELLPVEFPGRLVEGSSSSRLITSLTGTVAWVSAHIGTCSWIVETVLRPFNWVPGQMPGKPELAPASVPWPASFAAAQKDFASAGGGA
jgi:hypothetical protein